MQELDITLTINGDTYFLTINKQWTLLYVLREILDLTGFYRPLLN